MSSAAGASIATALSEYAFVITLVGDFDYTDREQLDRLWEEATHHPVLTTVIDLAGVDFGDSTLLGWLLEGLQLHRQSHRTLRIAGPLQRIIRQVFDVTGLSDHFLIHPFLQHALSAARTDPSAPA